MTWIAAEEATIKTIMSTESRLAPGAADMRIACNRPEALRRLVRRTRQGIYRLPSPGAMAVNLLPPTPKQVLTDAQRAAFKLLVTRPSQEAA
jgi:hypothetical protein